MTAKRKGIILEMGLFSSMAVQSLQKDEASERNKFIICGSFIPFVLIMAVLMTIKMNMCWTAKHCSF
jgi:hypothetical protein